MSAKEKLLQDIENQEKRLAQSKARLKDIEAREKEKQRKLDTRRKVIVGALTLQHAAINDDFRAVVDKLVNEHVTGKNERALFNLPPLKG